MKTGLSIAKMNLAILLAILCGCANLQGSGPIDEKAFDRPIRVACVGDSITSGYGLRDPARNAYPAQLAVLLGERWQVRNFGVGSTTLLKQGDFPYWKQKALQDALAFAPDVVVIALGTNDTKPGNWKKKENFVVDYVELVRKFQALDSKPRVWVCYPVPAFSRAWGLNGQIVKEEILPMVDQIAEQTKATIIDLHTALADPATMIGDGIHPTVEGAGLIAETVSTALTGRKPNESADNKEKSN